MIRQLSQTPPPLTPDADQARRWAQQELSDHVYQAARPTPLDRAAQAVVDFFQQLFSQPAGGGWGVAAAVVVIALAVVLIVVALIVTGRPRRARHAAAAPAELFGDVETRSAAQLRRAAASAAAAQDWPEAIVLRVRAVARALAETGVVTLAPGATVHAFARSAAARLPHARGQLEAAADAFDDVRYLRRGGTAEQYSQVAALDDAVAARSVAA